jgi:predicted metal-dependent peptidase
VSEVERKLTAARTRLILDKPFLGALVLRLPMIEADAAWCRSTATDARALYYNEQYIDSLNLQQVQFVLAHEALHCGLSHFARRDNRERQRWDVACDYAVNQLLVNDGLEEPPGVLFETTYDGMTAEEIYPYIDQADDESPMDQHLYDGASDAPSQTSPTQDQEVGQSAPSPLSEAERDELSTQWQQRLAGAAQQAAQAGKLDPKIARLIEQLLRPSVPWRNVLARFMNSSARIDYNLSRPSQRREGDAILPSLYLRRIDLVVAIDTSGSVGEDELNEFITELNAIKGSMNARITLLACDAALDQNGPWTFETWEPLELPDRLHGGGTTDFTPVFDWVQSNTSAADLLIYFTDARGEFPAQPSIATLWLVKGSAPVPWGQRIQLN